MGLYDRGANFQIRMAATEEASIVGGQRTVKFYNRIGFKEIGPRLELAL